MTPLPPADFGKSSGTPVGYTDGTIPASVTASTSDTMFDGLMALARTLSRYSYGAALVRADLAREAEVGASAGAGARAALAAMDQVNAERFA